MIGKSLDEQRQYVVLAILTLVATGATAILSLSQHNFFRPYFRNLNPS
jgi:hypothetical protein